MIDRQDTGASADAETGSRASMEPSSTVSTLTGFDPARITEAVQLVEPNLLQPIIKRAADEFYCTVLETAEDYLRENLDWNLKSHLSMLERENQRMRTELYQVDRFTGAMGSHEARMEALQQYDAKCCELLMLKAAERARAGAA